MKFVLKLLLFFIPINKKFTSDHEIHINNRIKYISNLNKNINMNKKEKLEKKSHIKIKPRSLIIVIRDKIFFFIKPKNILKIIYEYLTIVTNVIMRLKNNYDQALKSKKYRYEIIFLTYFTFFFAVSLIILIFFEIQYMFDLKIIYGHAMDISNNTLYSTRSKLLIKEDADYIKQILSIN
jgi:hypothetical protein